MNAKELGNMPAYPVVLDGETASNERIHPVYASGLSKREAFAMAAPADEISDMTGISIEHAAKMIGIATEDYDGNTHYPQLVAKARFIWADAMLAESAKDQP